MKKITYSVVALMLVITISKAQTIANQFSGLDCNGNTVDLFQDLDAGKAVILHYYMPSCGSCPPPAQKIQAMANKINALFPGKVKGYAFPYNNTTTCTYSSTWVSSNGLSALYAPMDSGAVDVAHYGGFGMPTVVLLGGTDHRVMFSTLSFVTSDTLIMRDSILSLFGVLGINDVNSSVSNFEVYPNPAKDNISISFSLKEQSKITIDLVDMEGKQVIKAMNENTIGKVTKQLNVATLPDGNYLVRVRTNGTTVTKKINIIH